VSRRPAGALAGIAMILFLVAPASGAPARRGVFDVSQPSLPLRDVVLQRTNEASARISATAPSRRYPIDDGSGATISVGITAACQDTCNADDPQQIASFIGTLIHGSEVESVTVQLDTPYQLTVDCGFGAQACYDTNGDRIYISGNSDDFGYAGVSREFVLAHEYGHHVAEHRRTPAPFPAAIDWGTERWATHEHICQGKRRGAFFPGNEGYHYYEDPGEAFAESFAFNRFPDAQVEWAWVGSLKPDAGAFKAIRQDVKSPWHSRRRLSVRGYLPGRGSRVAARKFSTPLDGKVSVRLSGAGSHRYRLLLRNQAGRLLRSSHGADFGRRVSYTVCGQTHLQAAIRRLRSGGGPFNLVIRKP
jgi:hypothetical protein